MRPSVDSNPSFPDELAAARRGDTEALARLASRYYTTVQRLVHHRLETDMRSGRPWLAARFSTGDVVQEVFQGVLKDLDAFAGKSEGAFIGYLSMVVRNRIIDAVRFHQAECRDGRRMDPAEAGWGMPAAEPDPLAQAAQVEQVQLLRTALERFAPREQLLLRARLEGQATFDELAEQLGFETESGARRAFYSAQARLVLILRANGEGSQS